MDNGSGAKSFITDKKIENIYKVVQMFKTRELIAQIIGCHIDTFRRWLKIGDELFREFEELGCQIADIYLDGFFKVQEIIQQKRPELEAQFLEETNQKEITVKNSGRFEEFIKKYHDDILEDIVSSQENEFINQFKFSENSDRNDELIKYAKFYRAYNRGCLAMKGIYIGNIDKHAGTGKNVGLSRWMLETVEDSFKPTKQVMDVVHKVDESLLGLSLKLEKEKE